MIDGLDVYAIGMEELVSFLRRLYESRKNFAGSNLKIFCTSRPEQPILDIWSGLPKAILRPDPKDLIAFIHSSVESLPDRFDNRMRRQLSVSLQGRAGQTFLWLSIMVREVRYLQIPTLSKIKEIIDSSPRDLDDLYDNLISNTLKTDSKLILVWAIYANRPLTPAELSDAVAIDLQKEYKYYKELEENRPHLTPASVHASLGTLIDVIDNKVYLIHQSLKDFFRRMDPLTGQPFLNHRVPRLVLAKSCMTYLALEDFSEIPPEQTSNVRCLLLKKRV